MPTTMGTKNYIQFAVSEQIRDDFYSFSLCNVAELSKSSLRKGDL